MEEEIISEIFGTIAEAVNEAKKPGLEMEQDFLGKDNSKKELKDKT